MSSLFEHTCVWALALSSRAPARGALHAELASRVRDCRDQVVIDARAHEVRAGDLLVSLERRPVVRRVLYTLAARAGAPVTREELTLAIWRRGYNARIHDNPLKVNVAHLRRLIAPAGLSIVADGRAYRLAAPARFLFLENDLP